MDRKITALKAQKRNPNRVSVYLDGEYSFGLAKIVAAWLQVGQVLTDEKINTLRARDQVEVAYLKALRLLSYRPRSVAEVEKRLDEQGYDQTVQAEVIARLKDNGFIGDEQFAQTWVENRNTFRPRSARVLALELRQKGVDEDVIRETLSTNVDEAELAYEAAKRYSRRLSGMAYDEFRKKLSGFLGRRGFSYGTIAPVMQQVWEEMQASQSPDDME